MELVSATAKWHVPELTCTPKGQKEKRKTMGVFKIIFKNIFIYFLRYENKNNL